MANERRKADLAEALEDLHERMRLVTELQRKRAELTGTGTAPKGYVTIDVNADSVVIRTRFSDDIGDLDFDEIAEAVTVAARAAVADVVGKAQALTEPLTAQRDSRPTLGEMLEDLTGVRTEISTPPPATLIPPGASVEESEWEPGPVESDAAAGYEQMPRRHGPGVNRLSW
ncbi:YbaB/EbfC family nucleoid-associated protein [Nocardia callitridis]|uniref:YbaB/EbfC family DNA-binding protein n=1 Tax=Nocardia callitridis TaxID=648753 RepID=A0ABP9KF26_9NOCA